MEGPLSPWSGLSSPRFYTAAALRAAAISLLLLAALAALILF